MRGNHLYKTALFITLSALALGGVAGVSDAAAQAQQFGHQAFEKVWARTDSLVASGGISRSFYWGPQPLTAAMTETYEEGERGMHVVQYFDKGRMEINNPAGDPDNSFFVTPGRLTMELVTGKMQLGNDQYGLRYPANIPIAGDTDDKTAPTYASFASISPGVAQFGENKTGQLVNETATKDRGYGRDERFNSHNIKYAHYEAVTKHNIPDVFWRFLNTIGPVIVNGRQVEARLSDPYYYVTGYPMTEPYWAYVKIAGKAGTPVLIQLYERRVLTYVPSAPQGWQVEMGNIGQHYYDWRYKNAGQPDPIKGCTVAAQGNFGKLWASDTVAQSRLFCPRNVPSSVAVAFQTFQSGYMVYIHQTGVLEDYVGPKRIYVLFDDGKGTYFRDYYYGEPEPEGPTPTAGMYTPKAGFGKVWRDNEEVRKRIGWALGPERTLDQSEFQLFGLGYMVRNQGIIYTYFEQQEMWTTVRESDIR